MKQTASNLFHQTPSVQLLRPWDRTKNGKLFYGQLKLGSKRHPLTSKQGNKTFYKGTRSSGVGSHTKHGGYVVNWDKVRTYVTPSKEVWNHDLTPLVSKQVPEVLNKFTGFKGPMDPTLYLKKLNEFIVYGAQETEDHMMSDKGAERG